MPQSIIGLISRRAVGALAAFATLHWTAQGAPSGSPGPDTGRYAGPLFDAMAQTDETLDGEAAFRAVQGAGVTHMALFARIHRRHDGRAVVAKLARAHPGFFVLGVPKYFDMRVDLDRSYVRSTLDAIKTGQASFVGEILYTHGDKDGGEVTATGERYIDPLQPNTAALLLGLQGRPAPVPVLTHWENYEWKRDWPKFDQLYGAFPHQIFVWPHAGFGDARELAAVLGAHPNVWATLSKRETDSSNLSDDEKAEATGPGLVDEQGRLLAEWREAILRYHDRLMFATDAHLPNRWSHYSKIVQRWRKILAQLPPEIAEDLAYRNAARLYPISPETRARPR